MTIQPSAFRTEWAGSSSEARSQIDDYEGTAGEARRAYQASVGKQAGDPARAARIITEAIDSEVPPNWLLLSKEAHQEALKKVDTLREQFIQWRTQALDADFPDASAATA